MERAPQFLFGVKTISVICHSSFVICHLSFVICHLSFVIRHSSFVIRHSSFDVRGADSPSLTAQTSSNTPDYAARTLSAHPCPAVRLARRQSSPCSSSFAARR